MASRQFPFRVGCVDAGSNAIRFLAAEFTGPTEFETLAYERVPVRLGHQVFLTGQLAHQAMDGAVAAFGSFRDQMKELGLDAFRAVATSATREAKNGQELVDRLKKETDRAGDDLRLGGGPAGPPGRGQPGGPDRRPVDPHRPGRWKRRGLPGGRHGDALERIPHHGLGSASGGAE